MQKPRVKDVLTTVLEVTGLAAITAGVALIWIPAAIILAGAALIGISYMLVRR